MNGVLSQAGGRGGGVVDVGKTDIHNRLDRSGILSSK